MTISALSRVQPSLNNNDEVSYSTAESDEEVIFCSLQRVPLSDANPFYALSYVWGDAMKTASIVIDGQVVHVRHNLYLFLRTLRKHFCSPQSTGTELRVWLDYVCINQNDISERNTQVSMMGEIFCAADAVYAWLGPPTSESDTVFKCINEIKELRAENKRWGEISRDKRQDLEEMQDIARRTYWTRLWIKQEVVLAKEVWFLCGEHSTNWKDLQFAISLSTGSARTAPRRSRGSGCGTQWPVSGFGTQSSTDAGAQAVTALLHSRSITLTKASLSELVARFRHAGCQDGRDRIYGLLSLVDEETSRAIEVDYTKPLLQVLLETYPHWTGESVQTTRIPDCGDGGQEVPIYQYESFCAQISSLFDDQELKSLCGSATTREMVSARAIFRTSVMRPGKFITIAAMDEDDVVPLEDVKMLKGENRGFVTTVQGSGTSSVIIYTNSIPNEGDMVAKVGSHVFLFRRHQGDPDVIAKASGSYLIIAATGIAYEASSVRRLALPGPCDWLKQQLPDGSLKLVPRTPKARPDQCGTSRSQTLNERCMILCNGAAILTLLQESRTSAGLDEIDRRTAELGIAAKGSELDGATQSGDNSFREDTQWSPWQFGLKHQILDACIFCKTEGTAMENFKLLGRSRRQTGASAIVRSSGCSCVWTKRQSFAFGIT